MGFQQAEIDRMSSTLIVFVLSVAGVQFDSRTIGRTCICQSLKPDTFCAISNVSFFQARESYPVVTVQHTRTKRPVFAQVKVSCKL